MGVHGGSTKYYSMRQELSPADTQVQDLNQEISTVTTVFYHQLVDYWIAR